MKNRFVKLTLFLCMIMLIGTSSSAFAASGSCGAQKSMSRNCGVVKYASQKCDGTSNYMALFGSSNDECMKALLKSFGFKVKQPVSSNNGNCGGNNNGSTNNSTNNTNNGANNSGTNCIGGNCNANSNAGGNQNCAGGNCNANCNANGNAGSGSNSNVNAGSYAQQVADLVNEERSKAGLSSLTMNASLSRVAQAKAEDMRDKNYFSHTSPTYGSPFDMMKQFGISYSAAGENIAKGQRSPESVMTAWMNSQGHRANILNSSYEQIGVGYCTDANGNTYWVQMFIK